MKRKIAILTLGLLLGVVGVVSAASVWGTYKGYNIIRLQYAGQTIEATDAPAISFNNRTMIPIYMLKEAGINYNWDPKTQTVDIAPIASQENEFVSEIEFIELNKVVQSNRAFITFMDQIELTSLSTTILGQASNEKQYNQAMEQVSRINIDALDDWVFTLDLLGAPETKYFEQITGYVSKAKNYLLNGDTASAHSQIIAAKSSMNSLYLQLDNRFTNTFGIKNQERFNK